MQSRRTYDNVDTYHSAHEYDYLEYLYDDIHPNSGHNVQALRSQGTDDPDDYLNQLATSSPSPPQRLGGRLADNSTPGHQHTSFGLGTDGLYYHGKTPSRPDLPSAALCHETLSQEQIPNATILVHNNNNRVHPSAQVTDRQQARQCPNENVGYQNHVLAIQQGISTSREVPSSMGPDARLRAVSELPDMYRSIFPFPNFNAMQSSCLDHIIASDCNLVVSGKHSLYINPPQNTSPPILAPTGSGKTVLFELAIIALLTKDGTTRSKVVYMAPTKSLCSEKSRDWTRKFDPLGIKTCELTGDTVHFGRSAWGDAEKCSIIVTTAEKWDSLTRHWGDHEDILSQIKLFLVDEVHILNEGRGSTLEVVISRMKTRGGSVRFLLVSATIPNIVDIANWINSSKRATSACEVLEFGEEYRPCKLNRLVIGVPRSNKQNEFQYATVLDNRLFSILQQHSALKPILIFCPTRKGTLTSATALFKAYEEAARRKERLPWVKPLRFEYRFHDKRLEEFGACGIGVHHAGLLLDDRRMVEDLFLNRTLRVLVATTTLSVGVNLPAHTVVIRGVKLFQNNTNVEYTDLDIMQMIGRAGRPQFDKDGLAIILCEPPLVSKYQALTQGKTVLESSLHRNLSEHLNSEIALGTITSVGSAKDWLRGSFLYQRMKQNPHHYALQHEAEKSWNEKLDDVVLQNISKLEATNLVQRVQNGDFDHDRLESTDYGDIMSKFYIRQSTMASILNLPTKPSLREILEVIASAEEFSGLKLRSSEKSIYNELRGHNDIRFSMKKVEGTPDKVFLLIQAILGNISLNTPEMRKGDSQPYLDALVVFKHASRLSKAVVEVAVTRRLGAQILYGLEATRCLTAKAWEERPTIFRQIEQIGEKSLKVFAEHGITSLDTLRQQSPRQIEMLLNRKPPFGRDVLSALAEIPKYLLEVSQIAVSSDGGKNPVRIRLHIGCRIAETGTFGQTKKRRPRYRDMTAILTLTSEFDLVDFRRIPTKALKELKEFSVTTELTKPSQHAIVLITSETFTGTVVKHTLKPDILGEEYPTLDTRPASSLALDLEGFENDPEFWNMQFDEVEGTVVMLSPEHNSSGANHEGAGNLSDGAVDRPMQLSNGKYGCSHTCTDKSKCLHLWEGKPSPEARKARACSSGLGCAPRKTNENKRRGPPKNRTVPPLAGTRNHAHSERHKRGLERLHEQADVQRNINMEKSNRLKLDSPILAGRKRKVDPGFTIHFTEVETQATDSVELEGEDGNVDLPDVGQLLASARVAVSDGVGGLSGTSIVPARENHTPKKRPRLAVVDRGNVQQQDDSLFLRSDDAEHLETPSPPGTATSVEVLISQKVPRNALATNVRLDPPPMTGMSLKNMRQTEREEFAELDAWLNSELVEMS